MIIVIDGRYVTIPVTCSTQLKLVIPTWSLGRSLTLFCSIALPNEYYFMYSCGFSIIQEFLIRWYSLRYQKME